VNTSHARQIGPVGASPGTDLGTRGQAMAWKTLVVQGREMKFASGRKAREFLLRAHHQTLVNTDHVLQTHHGQPQHRHNGRTYTAGKPARAAEFRGM